MIDGRRKLDGSKQGGPGVYIQFAGEGASVRPGARGTAAMALPLDWGEPKRVMAVRAGDRLKDKLGYDLSAPQLLLVREALKRAGTLPLYRLNTGTRASATLGDLTVTARYGGVRGNDISIVVQTNVDNPALFDVMTVVDGETVDTQTVGDAGEPTGNAWVEFAGTGPLTVTAGVPLAGGSNGEVTAGDHSDFLAALELHEFHTVALPSNDTSLKALYTAFVKRLRDDEGKKVQAVLAQYPIADHEGIISVGNGVVLDDGTALDAAQATAWVAGATAAASFTQSLTYQAYDGAVDANPRLTHAQIEQALLAGEFVFSVSGDRAVVEQDINSLTGFGPDKPRAFAKNRVMRVLDTIATDVKRTFEAHFIGKVDNNADGRNLFRQACIGFLEKLQDAGAIQNFDAQNDVAVLPGDDVDSIVVLVGVQPVDAVEKIYMKVTVR